ncbi:guanylate kinase [Arsukibacterium sp. MJ3]|uniref:guanylate kinase n=1 Tax=Arsukibacterium sp. MJ3 TaxID=1632859 RepID=UPI0006270D3C|nr:guanylate kinase [Arsukibacterium sp. MJ3]KKO49104.1 guanylate kinase [Arsukibacterium sp. MJ3]
MQQLSGNLFIVSAPSGAGKSSLINALLQHHSDMQVSVSHTTRSPRPGEQDGVHYHFISVAQFKALITENEFLEWAEVFGNYYGTSRSAIVSNLRQGIDVLLDIDWQGARQIRQQAPGTKGIFILPPSMAALEQRLVTRDQDSREVINKRMAKAQSEMQHADEYDYLIINDEFNQALNELTHIVLCQRNSLSSQRSRQQQLMQQLLAKPAK